MLMRSAPHPVSTPPTERVPRCVNWRISLWYRHSRASGSPGPSSEPCALDARFRGQDEKGRTTYADSRNEVLASRQPCAVVSNSGIAARCGERRVGKTARYQSRIIASTARRSTSGLRRLLRPPCRFEIMPVVPSVRYAVNSPNTCHSSSPSSCGAAPVVNLF